MRLHYQTATTPWQHSSLWVSLPWAGWQSAMFRTSPPLVEVTCGIDYVYDRLYRLTGALSLSGDYLPTVTSVKNRGKWGRPPIW